MLLPALPIALARRREHSGCPNPMCHKRHMKSLIGAGRYGVSGTSAVLRCCSKHRLRLSRQVHRILIAETSCTVVDLFFQDSRNK